MPMIFFRGLKALAAVAILGGIAVASPALAACKIDKKGFVAQDVDMGMGKVVVLPSTQVGGVIKELSNTIRQYDRIAFCDRRAGGSSIGEYLHAKQKRPVAGFADTYETNVPGVGIRLFRDSGRIQAYYPHKRMLNRFSYVRLTGGLFRIQLIKTAEQTGSGKIAPNGRFTTYYFDGDGPSRPVLTSTFSGSATTVISPTCEVDAGSRNIPVDFGTVPNTAFTGVGSKAVNRDFEIRLKCQGSNLAAYQSEIAIRLDADQDSSNMPGVLKLSAASNSATRIGIQMVQRDGSTEREVHFGEPVNVGTTTTGTSTMILPLRARYVQTRAGTVGAGVANGQATFTIQYE